MASSGRGRCESALRRSFQIRSIRCAADELEPIVAGKCQSLILNYERCLAEWFGQKEGIADKLRFPVFVSSLSQDAVDALKATYKRLPKRITSYVEEYDDSVAEDVRADQRYEFRVTDPVRSILDAAGAGTAPEQIEMAVRQALHKGLTTRRSLLARADRRGGRVAELVRRSAEKDGQS